MLWHSAVAQGAGTVVAGPTVPTGEVWLVRSIRADNRTGAAVTLMLFQLRSGVSLKWYQAAVGISSLGQSDGVFCVAEAGDVIQTLSSAAGTVHWGLFGSRLVV